MNGSRLLAKLVGAALVASTMIFGGCVAETADEGQDEPVVQSTAADTFVPRLPKTQGGVQGGSPGTPGVPADAPPSGDPGTPPNEDPDPNPWQPPGPRPLTH